MYRVEEVSLDALNAQEWEDLLSCSEVSDAFQTYEWGFALQNSMKVNPRFLLVKFGKQIIGGVMFFARRILGTVNSYEIRGGPLYTKRHKKVVMRCIIQAFNKKKKKAASMLFVPFPLINSSLGKLFDAEGYFSYPFRTSIIDLSRNLQDVWKDVDKKTRWGVRNAEKLGIEVKEANTWQEWEHYFHLHVVHSRDKQIPTDPPEFFRELYKLHHKNMARLFLAQREKRTVAGSLFLVYRQNMVFLQNASKTAFLSYNPNNLLQWKSIEWAKNIGVTIYDMNGLPPEELTYLKGVYHYKKQWNGRICWYCYYVNRRVLRTAMHLIRTNNLARKLFMSAKNLRAV